MTAGRSVDSDIPAGDIPDGDIQAGDIQAGGMLVGGMLVGGMLVGGMLVDSVGLMQAFCGRPAGPARRVARRKRA